MHAQIVLFDGFDPLDVIGPYEVLWAGGVAADGALTVELVSAEGPRQVAGGAGGLLLHATATLDPDRADLIIVPGAAGPISQPQDGPQIDTIPVPLARTLETDLPSLMRKAMEDPKVTVAAVCGGSLALAMAGLLEGRHAVTHHLGMEALGATGAIPVGARVVDDGDLVTAGGVTSGLDLGLYLLERELGPRIAHAVEALFEYERRGTTWHNRGLQAVLMERPTAHRTPLGYDSSTGWAMRASTSMANPFVHVELLSTDRDRARSFYGEVFDWDFTEVPRTDSPYIWLDTGGNPSANIIESPIAGEDGPFWLPYVRVDDLRATLGAVRSRGGTVVRELEEVSGMGSFAIVRDPLGATLGLLQPPEGRWRASPGEQVSITRKEQP